MPKWHIYRAIIKVYVTGIYSLMYYYDYIQNIAKVFMGIYYLAKFLFKSSQLKLIKIKSLWRHFTQNYCLLERAIKW